MSVAPDELFLSAGLDRAEVDARGLSREEGLRLWVAMETITEDPFVGLNAGTRLTLDLLGMVGLAFATANDLGDGLRVATRAIAVMIPGASIETRFGDGEGGVHYRTEAPEVRHGVDSIFAGIVALARECAGADVSAARVDLQSPAVRSTGAYERAFGVTPRFGQPSCFLAFDRHTLRRRFRGAEPTTSRLLLDNAEALVHRGPGDAQDSSIESAMLRSLEAGQGTLAHVADLLNESPRTLQRRLRDAGTSFQELRARLLRQRAERWLDRGMSVSEIAKRLGYASAAAFTRAFRQWTGITPSVHRARGSADE